MPKATNQGLLKKQRKLPTTNLDWSEARIILHHDCWDSLQTMQKSRLVLLILLDPRAQWKESQLCSSALETAEYFDNIQDFTDKVPRNPTTFSYLRAFVLLAIYRPPRGQ